MADINQKTSETEDSFKMDDINPYEASSSSNKTRRGIIYLSTVPTGMNVSRIREAFSEYGEVDRIYLARDKSHGLQRKFKKNLKYAEGWVEFLDKRIAKAVARDLNCTVVGRKKNSELWNMKYLPRFTWIHLNQRQAEERELRKQKQRFGLECAKKITGNFIQSLNTGKGKRKDPEPIKTDSEATKAPKAPTNFKTKSQPPDNVKKNTDKISTDEDFLQHLL